MIAFALGVGMGILLTPLLIVWASDIALARAERRMEREDAP